MKKAILYTLSTLITFAQAMAALPTFNSQQATDLYDELEKDFSENPVFQLENINDYRDGRTSDYVQTGNYRYNNSTQLTQNQINRLKPYRFVSREAFDLAIDGWNKIVKNGTKGLKKTTLTIVDFSIHETYRRLFVIDLTNKKVLFNTWVGHAYNSDPLRIGLPTEFSNKSGSNMSSAGFMVTERAEYYGMFGKSLRIRGLDPKLNSRVFARAVVFHQDGSASSQSMGWGQNPLRSQGCFTLPYYESGKFYGMADVPMNSLIIDKIKGGSLVFSYTDRLNAAGEEIIQKSDWL